MKGPGFPKPLFENLAELAALADEMAASTIEYLLFEAPIGPLRGADPILGDLTIMAQEAVGKVQSRLAEIRALEKGELSGTGGVPMGQA